MAKGLLHLLVRIQHHPLRQVVNQPDRQRLLKFAALRLAHDPFLQARAQNVQFGFAHGRLKAEH
jgi:hypothetical protein